MTDKPVNDVSDPTITHDPVDERHENYPVTDGGAVDHDYDENVRPARERLQENLDGFPREVKPHDVVIDLVEGRPLYVRRARGTAVEYFESEDFDLTTYKAHPWLPITPDDTIFECVFLPTKPQNIPGKKKSQTYDYPRGRLARVPVEWLYDSDIRPQEATRRALIAAMFSNAKQVDADSSVDLVQAVFMVARATFDDATVDAALEMSGVEGRNPAEDNADIDDFE